MEIKSVNNSRQPNYPTIELFVNSKNGKRVKRFVTCTS